MKFKLIRNMTRKELIEVIENIVADMNLWRCPKCGYFSPKSHVCWSCRYDYTNK